MLVLLGDFFLGSWCLCWLLIVFVDVAIVKCLHVCSCL